MQCDAPIDLLVGTDFQPHLGLHFMQADSRGGAVDLLRDNRWRLEQHAEQEDAVTGGAGAGGVVTGGTGAGGAVTGKAGDGGVVARETGSTAMVSLIQVTRLPAHHARMVQARVERWIRNRE